MATPFPFVASAVLTAAQLNSIGEAWVSYTPTVTQGVGVTATVTTARWTLVNKIVFVQVTLSLTSAGTAGIPLAISAPVAAKAASFSGAFAGSVGAGGFYDANTSQQYNFTVQMFSSLEFRFYANGTGGSLFGQYPAVGIANGDYVFFQATYEAA